MLLDSCRKLYAFYLDVAHVINSLESMGKHYKSKKHKEYYFERLDFYKKLLNSNEIQRASHFPKILKDVSAFNKNNKILEVNKHDLRIYSTLGNVGIAHGSNDLFSKY